MYVEIIEKPAGHVRRDWSVVFAGQYRERASINKRMERLSQIEPCCVLPMYSSPIQEICTGWRGLV